jgi:undecaprenyl pyrophosphate phosphatase UppP
MSVPAVFGAVVLFDIGKAAVIALSDATLMGLSTLLVGYATMSLLLRCAKKMNFAIFCISSGGLTRLVSQLPILL